MVHQLGEKRSAMEPAARLVEVDSSIGVTAKRPLTITMGAVLVYLRALGGVVWLASLWLVQDELARSLGVDPRDFAPLVWISVGAGVIGVVVLIVFATLILRGSNFARVVTMIVLTLSILFSAIEYFAEGAEITIQTSLINLAFDILVLLALSSRDARAWARRKRN